MSLLTVSTKRLACALALLPALLPAQLAAAQDPPKPMPPTPGQEKKPDGKPADDKPKQKPGTPKPYKDVITAEAKSDPGMFTVHHVDEKYYFEIPADKLNRDMLWTTEIAQLSQGAGGFGGGYGGLFVGDRTVCWTRRNNKIYLRLMDYSVRSDDKGAIRQAVENANLSPIIMAFDVEAEGKDKSAVIDATRLLSSDVSEFSAKGTLGGGGIDAARSYIDKVKSFPENIETRTLYTFTGGGGPVGPGRRGGGGGGGGTISALIHYSMVLLPETPMQGRLFDSRVGFFTHDFKDFGRPENRVVDRGYIARYRLVKKDPSAKVSEPVKPIVYYISREVPEKWRPYLKKGVEAWQPAFEKAGFKNAIICKDAPSVAEDPDWDSEDARYSVIRWAPTDFENAVGPHVSDPRSGEIMSAHIIVWHNVLKLAETWYFTQVSPLDKRAQKLPLPESLTGELMEYVVCHEVGHTLGLRHNHKASSFYSAAQLRNPTFTNQYGTEASIMDYGRFNYIAQPGDNVRLIPILGPYDHFAIEWGYTPLPGMKDPDAEKSALDAIAARQVSNPMLRFGGEDAIAQVDPSVQMEDLGSDPIEATRYGLKNIARVVKLLVPATTKYGEDYDLLKEMYDATLGQRRLELGHVAKLVGGVVETRYHAGRGKAVFVPVPAAKQAAAVKFLIDNALQTPTDLLTPDILTRIEPSGIADRVLGSQTFVLASLLGDARIKRLQDNEVMSPGNAYTVTQLVTDLQNGVWSELAQPAPTVSLYRRNLQRAYLTTMKARLVGDAATQTDLRPIAVGSLRQLARTIDAAVPKTKDRVTGLHLQECRRDIERILNPKN